MGHPHYHSVTNYSSWPSARDPFKRLLHFYFIITAMLYVEVRGPLLETSSNSDCQICSASTFPTVSKGRLLSPRRGLEFHSLQIAALVSTACQKAAAPSEIPEADTSKDKGTSTDHTWQAPKNNPPQQCPLTSQPNL